MTPQILIDLQRVADPGPRNSFMLDRVAAALKRHLKLTDTRATIAAEIEQHCDVRPSPSGPVLMGWYMRS